MATPKVTDRMLLAMHDAHAAMHANHKEIEDRIRTWLEKKGRQVAVAEYEKAQEKGGQSNG